MRRAFILSLALCAPAGAACAGAADPMTSAQLSAERGGLQTPLGLDIGFGATVRTFVDGHVALETNLVWTKDGAQVQSTGLASSATPTSYSRTIAGLGGATQVTHDLDSGRISSLIINTANNRDIRQQTDVVLTLPQLPALQRQVAGDRIAASIQSALGLALRGPK